MAEAQEDPKQARDANPTTEFNPDRLAEKPAEDAVIDDDDDQEHAPWYRLFREDTPFIDLWMLEQLMSRPYHAVTLEGPFDLRRLARDYGQHLFRSETSISRKGKPLIDRLLLTLGDGVYGSLDGLYLKVYAPTRESAAAAAHNFRSYVRPSREHKPHFFVVSVSDGAAVAESVAIGRSAPATDEDLELHYGQDFVGWLDPWLARVRARPSGLTVLRQRTR